MMGNWWGYGSGWGFFGMSLSWIFMLLFWGLILWGIVAFIQWTARQGTQEKKGTTALDILKERYAKGEIAKEEFEAKKKDLEN